jgi:hypothetical protein
MASPITLRHIYLELHVCRLFELSAVAPLPAFREMITSGRNACSGNCLISSALKRMRHFQCSLLLNWLAAYCLPKLRRLPGRTVQYTMTFRKVG